MKLLLFVYSSVMLPSVFGLHIKNRIVGGQNAVRNEYAFIVSLRDNANQHRCGGSIIGGYWVLTAAHCENSELVSVTAGIVNINETGTTMRIEKFIPHPNYNPTTESNDIALIRLQESFGNIRRNTQITYIVMEQNANYQQRYCTALGWGTTGANLPASSTLKYVKVQTVPTTQCNDYWGRVNRPINGNFICTNTLGNHGVCFGDSGGPLTAGSTLVGVTSFGAPCAVNGIPDVFTRVSAYYKWITDTTNNYKK